MAVAYIYPDSTISNTNWTVSGTVHQTLADIGFSLPVVDDDDDINSITVQGNHYNVTKGNISNYDVTIEAADGTDYYVETSSNIAPSDAYVEWNLTERTTSDGAAAWTESDINGLRLVVTGNVDDGQMRLNYIRISIDYNEPPAVYQSYEPNMKVEEGIIIIDEGVTIL